MLNSSEQNISFLMIAEAEEATLKGLDTCNLATLEIKILERYLKKARRLLFKIEQEKLIKFRQISLELITAMKKCLAENENKNLSTQEKSNLCVSVDMFVDYCDWLEECVRYATLPKKSHAFSLSILTNIFSSLLDK